MDTADHENPQTIKQICEITGATFEVGLNAFKVGVHAK